MTKNILVLFSCILLSSCSSTWELIHEKNADSKVNQLSIHLPVGWVLFNNHYNKYIAYVDRKWIRKNVDRIMLTHDGLLLDRIDIIKFDRENAFPSLKRSADKNAIVPELAELYIAEEKTRTGRDDLKILENSPSVVAGRNGFLVKLGYKNGDGLGFNIMTYGVATEQSFYTFTYWAPSIHFYDTYLPDFLKMMKSVSIT